MVVSIIVPVYNVEKYLEKCLESIIMQDLKNEEFEVIIVNDGSPDESQKIIDRYTSKYSNFIGLKKKNGGLSSARNSGLKIAKGEFILFLDSDDFLVENSLKDVLENIKGADVLMYDYIYIDNEGKKSLPKKYFNKSGFYSIDFFLKNSIVEANVWKYLFKRSIIEANKIEFIEGMYHEDEHFTLNYLLCCKSISYCDKKVIYYLQREESIMSTQDSEKKLKKLEDMIRLIQLFSSNSFEAESIGRIKFEAVERKKQIWSLMILLRTKQFKIKDFELKNIINKLRQLQFFPLIYSELTLKQAIYCIFLNTKYKKKL